MSLDTQIFSCFDLKFANLIFSGSVFSELGSNNSISTDYLSENQRDAFVFFRGQTFSCIVFSSCANLCNEDFQETSKFNHDPIR